MHPGEVVRVVKGEHEGKQALLRGSAGFFYHLQLLTPSGRKAKDGLVSLHRTAIKPLEKTDAGR